MYDKNSGVNVMYPEAFEQLDKDLLQKIRQMFSSGATIEQMLNILELQEPNAKLYRLYLEAACGEKLDGSIYLSTWNQDDRKIRLEILVYLKDHLERIRNRNL